METQKVDNITLNLDDVSKTRSAILDSDLSREELKTLSLQILEEYHSLRQTAALIGLIRHSEEQIKNGDALPLDQAFKRLDERMRAAKADLCQAS